MRIETPMKLARFTFIPLCSLLVADLASAVKKEEAAGN
jgi:hypothetical protein